MTVDSRLEVRVTDALQTKLAQRAKAEGISKSDVVRRGLRMVLGLPVRLPDEDCIEITHLRRRINAILSRVDALPQTAETMAARADLTAAHADAQALLRR